MPSLLIPSSNRHLSIASLRHSLYALRSNPDFIGQCTKHDPSLGGRPQAILEEVADLSYRLCGLLVETFPTELLVQIFLEVPAYRWPKRRPNASWLGECTDVAELRTPSPTKRLPWVFSHVCRRWREIVFSTPQLWTVVPTVDLSAMASNPLLEQHLLRSANKVPLSILCEQSHPSIDKSIISCISQYMERVEEVTFVLRSKSFPNFHDFQGHFRNLRAFHLIYSFAYPEKGMLWPPDIFTSASHLEELTLLHPLATPPPLPATLKKYHGYYLGASATLDFLARVPQLESCTFESPLSYSSGDTHPPLPKRARLTMSALRKLGLVNCPSLQDFLKNICLPKLEHLQVSFLQRRDPILRSLADALFAWSRAQGRTSLRILNLSIHGFIETIPSEFAHDLARLFSATPELEWLSYTTSSSHSLFTLLPFFRNRMFLPHLQTLLLDSGHLQPHEIAVVLDMVEYRRSKPNIQPAESSSSSSSSWSSSAGLLFFGLNSIEEGDIRGNQQRLDWGHNPAFFKFKEVAWRLTRCLDIPLDDGDAHRSQDFQQNLRMIRKDWDIQSVLATGLHLDLSRLLLQKSAYPDQPEFTVLDTFRLCVARWRMQSKRYFQEPRWFMFQNGLYWQAGGQPDAHEMFWEISPPRDGKPRHRRDPPLTYIDPIKKAHWKPDWEIAGCL